MANLGRERRTTGWAAIMALAVGVLAAAMTPTSAKPLAPDLVMELWEGPNFTEAGYGMNAAANTASLPTGDSGWDDHFSSVQIKPGWAVTLCAEPNYGGACQTFTKDVKNLPSSLNNKVSSYKLFQSTASADPQPDTGDSGKAMPGSPAPSGGGMGKKNQKCIKLGKLQICSNH